jgi:LuxR family maltose regulon positive regulatory protein
VTTGRPRRRASSRDPLGPTEGRPVSDLAWLVLVTKVTPPVVRANLVHRARLHEILERGVTGKLTLVDAPAGWGKTTLVSDWLAKRPLRGTAWLSLDPDDGDPVRFWSYVIEAMRTVHPTIGDRALELLHAPRSPPLAGALPSLVNELADLDEPLVVVLDDYHVITNGQVHAGMVFVLDHLPPNVRLVVLTRSDPPFPISRWRVRGEVVELRADDLRFDISDAGSLLNGFLGLGLPDTAVAVLQERTEGWAAGLYLAALSLRRHPDPETFIDGFAGDDRHIVDYLGSEVLDALPDDVRSFLVRTSILERLTSPLCDAVTASTGSRQRLAEIERTNRFLVPLDTRGQWYRYHQLFGELLRLELDRTAPTEVADLHRRAAAWLLDHGLVAEAIRHTTLAHDRHQAADLIAEHWATFLQGGELAAVIGWLDAVGDDAVRSDPRLCLVRAWMTINVGRVTDLPDWIDAAERAAKEWSRHGAVAFTAAAAMLRCIEEYLTGDVGAAISVAQEALALDAEELPPWRSVGCPVLGIALFWTGDVDGSAAALGAAMPRAERAGNHLAVTHALGCLALAAAETGRSETAEQLAGRAMANSDEHGFRLHWANAMAHHARGKTLLSRGDLDGAARSVGLAVELSRRGVARIELVYGLLTLAEISLRRGERAEATKLVAEAQAALDHCRDAGVVAGFAADLADRLGRRVHRASRALASGDDLTERELVVLALLPTDLTLRELAGTLYVSFNTVKSQTRAIYRKLGVTSRDEAVVRARQLGLA